MVTVEVLPTVRWLNVGIVCLFSSKQYIISHLLKLQPHNSMLIFFTHFILMSQTFLKGSYLHLSKTKLKVYNIFDLFWISRASNMCTAYYCSQWWNYWIYSVCHSVYALKCITHFNQINLWKSINAVYKLSLIALHKMIITDLQSGEIIHLSIQKSSSAGQWKVHNKCFFLQ